MMKVSKEIMAFKSYQNQAEVFEKEYLPADPLIPYISIVSGIFACKMVGCSMLCCAVILNAISTVHAIFITTMSLCLVFCSNIYSDDQSTELITVRSSSWSKFAMGVSVGYFLADIGMIFWFYPSLGGFEYVIHHLFSVVAVAYSMFSGEGRLYTYVILISETTTPGINLRWYLDVAGMKRSKAYLINGVAIFVSWLVEQMHSFGKLLVMIVPSVLGVMNLTWFSKIIRGLRKTFAKRQ